MKKFILKFAHSILFLILSSISFSISAAGPLFPKPSIIFDIYEDGLNIPCHGGTIDVNPEIFGGSPPYTYEWKNSAGTVISTNLNLTSALADTYTLTLYKNGNNSSWNVTVTESSAINVTLVKSVFAGGYNISYSGGHDGTIDCIVQGGVPSYYYQWSNGNTFGTLGNLSSGTYSVTITDEYGCTATKSTTLTAPTPLVVSNTSLKHNTYDISCYGGSDGAINLTVSGGVPPYSYSWNDGIYTKDRSSLSAGPHTVIIDDANPGGRDTVLITLNQPSALSVTLTSPILSSGFNTSCYSCKDGKIIATVTPGSGVSPYTYIWNNGKTTFTLDSLGKGIDTVTVTDNNGCILKKSKEVTADIEGWKIGGNLGIDTSKQFMGTKDSIDLILKTNGKKRMTVTADGTIEMNSPLKILNSCIPVEFVASDYRVVFAKSDGTLNYSSCNVLNAPICQPELIYAWQNIPNTTCPSNTSDIFLRSDLRNVGIGTGLPTTKLDVVGGIRSSNLSNRVGFNPVYVNEDGILKKLNSPSFNPSLNVLHGDGSWSELPTGSSAWNYDVTTASIYNNPLNAKVGIGTTTPSEAFQIGDRFTFHNGGNKVIGYNFSYNGTNNVRLVQDFSSAIYFDYNGQILFKTAISSTANSTIAWTDAITIKNDGKVGIGTFTSSTWDGTYKLYVKDGIRAEKIKVDVAQTEGWADYVFAPDYKLTSLVELDKFINKNRHLPEIPTSEEVYKNGIDLAEIQAKLLKKIEELTLYVIELNKKNIELSSKFDELKNNSKN